MDDIGLDCCEVIKRNGKPNDVANGRQVERQFRDQLVVVIQAALQAASQRQVELEHRRQQRQERQAQAKERMLVNEYLLRKHQKVRQLMERFNSLMAEAISR